MSSEVITTGATCQPGESQEWFRFADPDSSIDATDFTQAVIDWALKENGKIWER